ATGNYSECWQRAMYLCRQDRRQADPLCNWLAARARFLVTQLWPSIQAVAKALLAEGCLSGKAVRQILADVAEGEEQG
ncbi:MAG: hypothetical protein AB7F89_27130, partial [Pirellulaceae bacterium]